MGKLKANFKTNVLLKNIIGQDLINNDNIAILELVKNSFDAGSKEVKIIFRNLKENDDELFKSSSKDSSTIIIQDFGSGMNKKDLLEKWLNIAYSEKRSKKEEFGRLLAGIKGIGRFSCDRLGKFLNIYTKKNDEPNYWHLFIDWRNFEIGDKNLEIQDIPVIIENILPKEFISRSQLKPFSNGTVVEISKLRANWTFKEKNKDAWNLDSLLSLRRYLGRLINPNQAFGKENRFIIEISAPDFHTEDSKNKELKKFDKILNGRVENKIFKTLDFRTTSIEASITIKNSNKELLTILKDKGREIYELKENISNNETYQNIDSCNIIIYFLNTYAKIYFSKQTGQRSVDFGSIFLFKNGFRVSPYGDEGDDWLGLEVRKGQGQRRFLGTRDIVGRIELKDLNNVFREVTSREGLINNEAFRELKGVFLTVLRRLERYVVEGLKWDSVPQEIQKDINKRTDFKEELFQLSQKQKDVYAFDAIKGIIKTQGKDVISFRINPDLIYSLAEEERGKFEKLYEDLDKSGSLKLDKKFRNSLEVIKKMIDQKNEEIEKLKERAVIVDSDDLFKRESDDKDDKEVVALQHHINQSTERIRLYLHELRPLVNSENNLVSNYLDRVGFENKKISTLAKFVTKAKFNLVTTSVKQDLVQFIKEYITNVYQYYDHNILRKQTIDVVILMKENFQFIWSFRPIDFIIIIDNILANAQTAGASIVEISIQKKSSSTIAINFRDNGGGLDPSIKDLNKIFDFGFTTSPDGTGIGLYHVRSVLKRMNGEIEVLPNTKGIEFSIIINK